MARAPVARCTRCRAEQPLPRGAGDQQRGRRQRVNEATGPAPSAAARSACRQDERPAARRRARPLCFNEPEMQEPGAVADDQPDEAAATRPASATRSCGSRSLIGRASSARRTTGPARRRPWQGGGEGDRRYASSGRAGGRASMPSRIGVTMVQPSTPICARRCASDGSGSSRPACSRSPACRVGVAEIDRSGFVVAHWTSRRAHASEAAAAPAADSADQAHRAAHAAASVSTRARRSACRSAPRLRARSASSVSRSSPRTPRGRPRAARCHRSTVSTPPRSAQITLSPPARCQRSTVGTSTVTRSA